MTNRDKLAINLDSYSKIIVDDLKELKDLENLPVGIYSIDKLLPFHILKVLSYFRNCGGEVGIYCIDNNWILTTSPTNETTMDQTLMYCTTHNLCQFSAHSHPARSLEDGRYVGNVPSEGDLRHKGIDKKLYIFSIEGFTEVSLESVSEDIVIALNYGGRSGGRIGCENPEDRINTLNSLYDTYGVIRKTIGFDNEPMIMEIINNKKNLKTDFWNEENFDFLRECYFLR